MKHPIGKIAILAAMVTLAAFEAVAPLLLAWQLHWLRQPLPACLPIVALSGLGLSTAFAIGYGLHLQFMESAKLSDLQETQRSVVDQPYSGAFWHEQFRHYRSFYRKFLWKRVQNAS